MNLRQSGPGRPAAYVGLLRQRAMQRSNRWVRWVSVDERRATRGGRRGAGDERRATRGGRRTAGDERRATRGGRRTAGDERRATPVVQSAIIDGSMSLPATIETDNRQEQRRCEYATLRDCHARSSGPRRGAGSTRLQGKVRCSSDATHPERIGSASSGISSYKRWPARWKSGFTIR